MANPNRQIRNKKRKQYAESCRKQNDHAGTGHDDMRVPNTP
jgi:hypothetical protein